MTFLQSLILGIIQGLTEFLPISSSAHLVLIPYLFNWNLPESQVFPFDVLVQIGTLVAVIIYFWNDLITILKAFFRGLVQRKPFEEPNARLGWYLILATIPAGLAGVLLKSKVEAAFNSPRLTAYFLMATAVMLLAAEFFSRRSRTLVELKWYDALWIGVFQALSIFPGVSRSGSTITGGMTRHFDRPSAARFSFLMSIPVMIAAGAMSLLDLFEVPNLGSFLPVLAVGFITALVVGYLSIHWLLSFLKKRSLVYFAAYCALMAIVVIIIGNVRGETNQTPAALTPGLTQPAEVHSTEISTASVSNIEYTASLDWMIPAMTSCADKTAGISIVTHLVPGSQSTPSKGAILLRWGEPPNLTEYSSQLGINRLEIVVNPANPVNSLTAGLVQQISDGKLTSWNEVYENCPECFTAEPETELGAEPPGLNFFLAGEEIQDLFDQVVMANAPVSRATSILIPSTLKMREAVVTSPSQIGFLPSGAIDASVKPVTITGIEDASLTLPILAISGNKPQGAAEEWLKCLQQSLIP